MSALTPQQLETLLARLHDRAEVLHAEIGAALHQAGGTGAMGLADHKSETDDDAVADLETSLDVAAVARDVRELYDVEKALRRSRTGDFGACADCGADIPFARLLAQPAASRCVSCQAKHERARAQSAPGL